MNFKFAADKEYFEKNVFSRQLTDEYAGESTSGTFTYLL